MTAFAKDIYRFFGRQDSEVERVSVILQETEDVCLEMLAALEGLSADAVGVERMAEIKVKLEGVKNSVSRSKKKIMVRTEEGKALSMQVKTAALALAKDLKPLQETPNVITANTLVEPVMRRLEQLEREARKVETYWKSYEAAIT
jgi:hypothetical protein